MKKSFISVVLFWLACQFVFAQQPLPYETLNQQPDFFSLEEALADPDKAYKLDLSGAGLSGKLDGLKKLGKLQILKLGANPDLDWESVFSIVSGFANLQVLHLQANNLESIPSSIGSLAWLSEIYLAQNKLKSVPSEIGNLEYLRIVSLSSNKTLDLNGLVTVLSNSKQLQLLELADCDIVELPQAMGSIQLIKQLDLKDNKLKTLPDIFGKMPALVSVDLSGNGLEKFPIEITKAPRLLVLDISRNPDLDADQVIETLASNTKLRILKMADNKMDFLSSSIAKMAYLQVLDLGFNRLMFVPSEIGQLKYLQKLILRQNQINVLPEEISQLSRLKELNMLGNPIPYLPPGIDSLTSLQSAIFMNTQMSDDELRKLKNALPNVQVFPDPDQVAPSYVELESLDGEIESPENVLSLNLNGKGLSEIPEKMLQLNNLQKLDLGGNPTLDFEKTMAMLEKLPYLQILNLQNNGLTKLPSGLGNLKLRQLFLGNNLITKASEEFSQLKGLEILFLTGNPLPEEEKEKLREMLPGTLVI